MARQRVFSLRVDATQVTGYAEFLEGLTPEALAAKWVNAINSTVDSAYDLSRRTMLMGINLTEAYVQRKMELRYATSQKPVGEIVARTGEGYEVGLSHYGRVQLTEKVNWSNARIQAAGHKFGKWPGWTRRTGNVALGIQEDTKARGLSVEVVKGRRKDMGPTFSIPGKADREGNPLVFRRSGKPGRSGKKGGVEALHGPSVYQLFRVAIPKISEKTEDDLRDAIVYEATRLFGG